MTADPNRSLVHQVRNLLAVVQTQTEVARLIGTPEAAKTALDLIERCAADTHRLMTELRTTEAANRAQDSSGGASAASFCES